MMWSLLLLTLASSLSVVKAAPLVPAAQPQTIILSARTVSTEGKRGLTRRALPPTSVPLEDFFLGTDLQWYGLVQVGTPPQNFTVVLDTGSQTLEIPGTVCGAACDTQKRFNPSLSSTYKTSGRTSSITFATGVGVDPVVGDNYSLDLLSITETITVGGLKAPATGMYLITDQTEAFRIDPFDGIMGLGAASGGFFKAVVNQGLPALFSMYLTPNASGKTAELTLGGIDSTKFAGSLTYASLPAGSGSTWLLTSSGITVNGVSTSTLKKRRTIIFDSGTSNILLDKATTEAIYAKISPNIKANKAQPGTYGIPCGQISSLPAVISFTFTSQSGAPFNLDIPSSELSVGPFKTNPSLCQTLINVYQDYNIIGGSLLKHYYSVWDVQKSRMGFAPTGL